MWYGGRSWRRTSSQFGLMIFAAARRRLRARAASEAPAATPPTTTDLHSSARRPAAISRTRGRASVDVHGYSRGRVPRSRSGPVVWARTTRVCGHVGGASPPRAKMQRPSAPARNTTRPTVARISHHPRATPMPSRGGSGNAAVPLGQRWNHELDDGHERSPLWVMRLSIYPRGYPAPTRTRSGGRWSGWDYLRRGAGRRQRTAGRAPRVATHHRPNDRAEGR